MPDLPISALPAEAALILTDQFVTNTGGVTKRLPASQIVAYIQGPAPNGVDDTTVLAALVATPNIHVQLQAGTYLVSAPIVPATGVVVEGMGRRQTIIKGLASWTAGATNSGIFNFTSATSLYSGNGFANLQFDLTAVTYVANHICCIHQNGTGCQIQHFVARDLWFELTANANSFGLELEGLGGLTGGGTSFDITVDRVFAHNGSGSVLLYLNSVHAASIAHSIFVQNIVSLVDVNGVSDDRVLIAGNAPSGGGNPEVRDVAVRGVYTTVASNVTSGRINGVKVDSGSTGAAYVHNVSIRDVFHRNYGSGLTGCNPVIFLLGSSSFIQDIFIDNVYGISSGAITLRLGRFETDPSITITNVHLKSCTDIFCLEVYARTTAVGDETVLIRNVSLHNSNAVSGNTPTGILLTSGAAGQGGSGLVLIDGCELENLSVGITNNLSEALGTQASAWSSIVISNTDMSTVTTPKNLINTHHEWNYGGVFDLSGISSDILFAGSRGVDTAAAGALQLGRTNATSLLLGAAIATLTVGNANLVVQSGTGGIFFKDSGNTRNNLAITNGGVSTHFASMLSGKATPAYSASITPDASAGNWQTITVTNATAFTINAPTNPPASTFTEELAIEVLNSSGGAMGVITWNAAFVFAGITWVNPASTKKRSVTFIWNGANWIARDFTSADY